MTGGVFKKIASVDVPVLRKPSILFLIFCACFSIWTMDLWRSWHYSNREDHPFKWDVAGYYSYLPATFIYDYSFIFHKSDVDFYVNEAPKGGKMSKYTYGMALMYSPFFALAAKISANTNSPVDGYNYHFSSCIHWGSIFYGLLGLLLLRNFLIKFFSETVTTITLAILFFGTNLFYYILSLSEMTHGYLFTLSAAFLLATYHWHKQPGYLKTILVGFLFGLLTLIRPPDALIGLLFAFWMVKDRQELKDRFAFWLRNYKHVIVLALVAFLVWLPQLLFWKYKTGQYFYDCYSNEHFFWTDPQIINILFSYRKGWFLYTPLMLLAFAGFFFMKGQVKPLRYWILGIALFNIYMMSCWWDWGFSGSFGARCFIQHYSFLSVPLAALIAYIFEDVKSTRSVAIAAGVQTVLLAFIFSGMCLNVGQSYQALKGYIHHNGATRKSYWFVFRKYKLSDEELSKLWSYEKAPDNQKLMSGEDRSK